ncbi:MAG: carbohydrate kinase family protein [Candidatus Nezhaarchaeota archaeon]|nr:carbohydrate kinase family protein [Candidatus Nezhaarchaeota archaeon]
MRAGEVRAAFIGHVSVDKVVNPRGERVQPGGAALYAAMASKALGCNPLLVTAIGYDYYFKELLFANFPSQGIKVVRLPSTRFEIVYDESWRARYAKVEIGAGSRIAVRDVLKPLVFRRDFVHIAPVRPLKALRIVEALKREAPGLTVSINTCSHYLEGDSRNRAAILKAVEEADIAILSDEELKLLTGVEAIVAAARKIKAKTLVVTLGEVGALIKQGGAVELTPALTVLAKQPVDVTGAGDTWSGAFLTAYFISEGNLHKATVAASILSAIKCSAWNFEALRGLRLKSLDEVIELATSVKEPVQLTKWLKEGGGA